MFFALLNGTFGISAASTADINSRGDWFDDGNSHQGKGCDVGRSCF